MHFFLQNKLSESIFYLDDDMTFYECNIVGNTKGKEFFQNTATLYNSYYDGDPSNFIINSLPKPIQMKNIIFHLEVVLQIFR